MDLRTVKYNVKGKKVKLSLRLTNETLRHEDVWGSGCIDPRFLDLGTSWRFSGQLHAPGEEAPSVHQIGGWVNF
jgi:hypothetical protein